MEIVAQTKAVQDLAQGTALKTQAAMEIQANKKRREVDFTVGNSVYVMDEPEPPAAINGEPEWEMEGVLASRLFGRSKKLQYQVSWKGYDPDDVWYSVRNLKNSSTLLETFHKDYPDAAGPPLRLAHCIRAAATDEYDDDHPDDDKAAHGARGVGKSHATRHK